MKSGIALILGASLCLMASGHTHIKAPKQTIQVTTAEGPVEGYIGAHSAAFLGIPYAAPPLGALRFANPRPHPAWTKIRNATEAGPPCQQLGGLGMWPSIPPLETFSEDCLTANVFTPRGALPTNDGDGNDGELLPVLFFIHGGGFVGGSGYTSAVGELNKKLHMTAIYDGEQLAALGNVVVVSINYRVGAFGFLALDALAREDARGATGNAGLLDQREALRWVQRNARAFGGDPAKVTLFGESAGGESVVWHLVSPGSKGLFRGGIIESGAAFARPLAEAEAAGDAFVAALGCNSTAGNADGGQSGVDAATTATLACIRAVNASAVLKAGEAYGAGSVVDGVDLPATPMALFAEGKFARVPVVVGTNRDEASILSSDCFDKARKNMTAAAYAAAIRESFGPKHAAAVLKLFPATGVFPTPRDTYERVSSDERQCAAFAIADAITAGARKAGDAGDAAGSNPPVFTYHLMHGPWILRTISAVAFGKRDAPFCVGVPHGTDLLFIFDNYVNFMNAGERALAHTIVAAWSNFARTLDPSGPATSALPAVAWPAHSDGFPTVGDQATAVLNATATSGGATAVRGYFAPICVAMGDCHKYPGKWLPGC